jgi:glycosyltransferase involved in cell wall biosynthesis
MMDPLVSILIPAYNAEKWIKDTMESALNQTWQRKEIIIVDDGSSDNTAQIIKKYESKSVKVITQKNMGGPAARNKALFYAQGDFIQWLDHDDILAPDKIFNQLRNGKYDGNPRVLLSGSFGKFYYRIEKAKYGPDSLWKDLKPIDYFLIKFRENTWLHPSVWLVSRKLTDMAGPWCELKSPDDDGEYFCRIVAACEKIIFVPEAKSYWRVGNFKSMSQNRSDEALEALFLSTFKSINHLRSLEDSEITRSACLQFLQTGLIDLYPDQTAILEKANNLAKELGGELSAPALRWKYSIIKQALGWRMAKRAQRLIPMFKVMILRNWDKLLYNLRIKYETISFLLKKIQDRTKD